MTPKERQQRLSRASASASCSSRLLAAVDPLSLTEVGVLQQLRCRHLHPTGAFRARRRRSPGANKAALGGRAVVVLCSTGGGGGGEGCSGRGVKGETASALTGHLACGRCEVVQVSKHSTTQMILRKH